MRNALAASFVMVVLVGCADDATQPAATPSPTARLANVLIDTGDESVLIRAEVADTPELRSRGLSERDSLDDGGGMVFLFFEETSGGFWMKDTTIPLSIAFFDGSGKILAMFDMEPCEADPCKTYDPGIPYRGALEVNRGAFDEWDVEVGDHIRVSP